MARHPVDHTGAGFGLSRSTLRRLSGDGPGGFQDRRYAEPTGPTEEIEGTVKFYNVGKSYGFVTPDGGGQDVFIHAKVLARSGLDDLEPQQRVRLMTTQGPRGPQATSVELI